jgi:hypothetical protein
VVEALYSAPFFRDRLIDEVEENHDLPTFLRFESMFDVLRWRIQLFNNSTIPTCQLQSIHAALLRSLLKPSLSFHHGPRMPWLQKPSAVVCAAEYAAQTKMLASSCVGSSGLFLLEKIQLML